MKVNLGQRGYGLVEQISAITVATVLMTVSVPSYRYVTNSNRVTAEVNGLLGDMEFARSRAVSEGQPVTVCPSTDGMTCATGSIAWNLGWIVFSDPSGEAGVPAPGAILRTQASFAPASDTFISPPGTSAVTFNREGFAATLPAAPSGNVTITLHTQPSNTQWTRCLQVSVVGLLTTEHAGQGDCT
jgi:type IV fimbrial biogenesis protein FimT